MVPLELRTTFNQTIEQSDKLRAFNALVHSQDFTVEVGSESAETDQIFYGCLKAIILGKEEDFVKQFLRISKRSIPKNSTAPYIQDDYLLFTLIVGVKKFGLETEWLGKLIAARNPDGLTKTFENVLNDNLAGKNVIPEVVFVYMALVGIAFEDSDITTRTYRSLIRNTELLERNEVFMTIISLTAYDLILEKSFIEDSSGNKLLLEFKKKFYRRTQMISMFAFSVLVFTLLFGLYFSIKSSPMIKDQVNDIAVILGISGFSIVGNIVPFFRKWFHYQLMRTLGYPKELGKTEETESTEMIAKGK